MNNVLGLIDALEALILDGKKVPFSDKVMISEKEVLRLLDKVRLVINSDDDVIRQSVEVVQAQDSSVSQEPLAVSDNEEPAQKVVDYEKILADAMKEASTIKVGANEYADNMLANLQLLLVKMQKNLISLERNIENGRKVIDQTKQQEQEIETDENR